MAARSSPPTDWIPAFAGMTDSPSPRRKPRHPGESHVTPAKATSPRRKLRHPGESHVTPAKATSPRRKPGSSNPPRKERKMKEPCVYLLASRRNGTLYVGVTSNLVKRVWQHREDLFEGSPSDTAFISWSGTSV